MLIINISGLHPNVCSVQPVGQYFDFTFPLNFFFLSSSIFETAIGIGVEWFSGCGRWFGWTLGWALGFFFRFRGFLIWFGSFFRFCSFGSFGSLFAIIVRNGACEKRSCIISAVFSSNASLYEIFTFFISTRFNRGIKGNRIIKN